MRLPTGGRARGRPIDVLAQVNVSGEGTKGGYEPATFEREAERLCELNGLVVRGIMTMAPLDAGTEVLRAVSLGATVASCPVPRAIRRTAARCERTGAITKSQSRRAPLWCASVPCCSERDRPNGRDLSSHAARRAALRLRRSLRGYDPERVEQFREQVAEELERLTRQTQELEAKAKGFHEQLRAFHE